MSSTKKFLYSFLGVILFFAIWIAISIAIDERTMIFPDPLSTFKETVNLLKGEYVYRCLYYSSIRTLIGFAISLVVGLFLGILSGSFIRIKYVLAPIFSVLKSIPTASIVFLFLALAGAKDAPIYMVSLISLPIIYESVVRGFENVSKEIIFASRIDDTPFWKRVFKIELPIIVPYVMVGIASSFSLSFKIEIMAEVISGSTTNGIGSAILASKSADPTNMTPIFAYSLIAILIVAILSLLLLFAENGLNKLTNQNSVKNSD